MAELAALREREAVATRRFMTFRVAGGLYAIPAEGVREVVRPPVLARVPLAPKALLGLGNLRGSVLPVASLGLLLGRADREIEERTRVVVLDGKSPFGIIVDEVDALVDVATASIGAAEAGAYAADGDILAGVFQTADEGREVRILDIHAVLAKAFGSLAAERQIRTGVSRQVTHQAATTDDREILIVFTVAGQEFALPIANVIEIMPAPEFATPLPQSETVVSGMIGLRGNLLPLLALKQLLGLTGPASGGMIIVASIGPATVGLSVDGVREIMRVERSTLEPVPAVIASRTKGEAKVQSVIKANDGARLISVLGPEQLFREDVMTRIKQQASAAPSASKTGSNVVERIFLVFRLGGQEFGLTISAVEEVAHAPQQVTRLPRAPDFLKGVINLRGSVLPIIDQRKRFDLAEAGEGDGRRLVVMRIGENIAGLIVDGVSEVLRVPESAVEPAPELDGTAALLEGVLNDAESGRMILLLDPRRLLTTSEAGLLETLDTVDGSRGDEA